MSTTCMHLHCVLISDAFLFIELRYCSGQCTIDAQLSAFCFCIILFITYQSRAIYVIWSCFFMAIRKLYTLPKLIVHISSFRYDWHWYILSYEFKFKKETAWNVKLVRQTHLCIRFNTLRPKQNGRHFADDTFNNIFVNENVRILITFSLIFVPKGSINNIPALVQIMAWRRWGDKPLSEPMMVRLPTDICVTRPQWVNCSLQNVILYTCTNQPLIKSYTLSEFSITIDL